MGRQDLVCDLAYSGAWQPAPLYVRDRTTITRGQGNETGGPTPQTLGATVDNRSGSYNPRNAASPLFGLIGRNTPIRAGLDLAVESFAGTSSSGWTPTDTGQPWTGVGAAAADFTESGGVGRHLQPLKNIVRVSLLAEERRDVEQVTEASIPAVAVGASAVLGHVARRQAGGDYYWLRMEFDVGGAMTAKISRNVGGSFTELAVSSAIPGLTYTAGQSYTLRSSVSGPRLSLRVWPTGTPEPAGWTLTAVDASPTLTGQGRYGLASWVVAGNTNTTEVRFDNYRAVDRRFHGEVASWKPGRTVDFNPATGKGDAWTEVEAAGILRRLGQGEQPTWSALRRTLSGSGPVAYWPAEDGDDASMVGSAISGHGPLTIAGTATFADIATWTEGQGYTVRYGSAALVDIAGGASLSGDVPDQAATGGADGWTVAIASDVADAGLSGDLVLAEVATPGGTFTSWRYVLTTTGRTQIIASNGVTTTTVADDASQLISMYSHNFAVWQSSPGVITAGFSWDGVAGFEATGTIAGTVAGVSRLTINPTRITAATPMPTGHLVLWPGHSLDLVDQRDGAMISALFGWEWTGFATAANAPTGEPSTDRVARVCTEAGVPLTLAGAVDLPDRMGRQRPAKFADVLDQVADVDGGYLYEPRDGLGLAYRPRDSLYNQAPVLTVDWSAHQVAPPFTPVVDDLAVRNDITVKRTDGSSARAVQTSGPLAAVPPPDGIGVYDTSVELNLADDSRLADLAGWALHKGTVDELRVSRVTVDLVASPGLAAAATAVDVGDRILLTGLPADMGDDEVSLIVVGYTEVIGSHTRTITFNCVPASPYDVATVDGEPRWAMDGGTLAAAITATATSLSLAWPADSGGWTTKAEDFPLDLRVGGERVTVSAITGTSSPQTATVSARAVNGVAVAWPAGTEVDEWLPAVVAL